ncbi:MULTISPECIES: restriction endonuclease subunit S [Pseudanabaena]|uniref:restriction endonuclease subunit S n=1 Tax=Pseudanabaena TaxID=1152 RepID=UPI00247ACFD0|nr:MULTISPECIES: restriction endonuclease subunit S [Pseudanabaena]MEA5486320.1 restriction endonuclease subunit S [Pseudanabaena sp. CCNP1317]WGS71631.1 restriction endonuclease subunit S [Pseudanabaena galeata CCNP1313]
MSSDFSILSDNDDLPMGWELTKMEDLVIDPKSDIVDGPFGSNLKASEYQDTGIPIIRLQNIDRNRFINSNIKFVSPEKAESLARHSFVKGNIAITKLGEPLGKACIIPDFLEKGIIVADIVRVRVDEDKVNSTYLTYSINSQDVIEQLQNQTKGTTRARVNLSHIREIQIPLPPLNEQRRIVEKVEALMARSRKSKEALDSIPKLIEQFRQSVLAAAFRGDLTADWREQNPNIEPASVLLERIRKERREKWEQIELEKMMAKGKDPLTDNWKEKYKENISRDWENVDIHSEKIKFLKLPDNWQWSSVEAISNKVVDGVHKKPNYIESGIPFITVKNLTVGSGISFEDVKYISKEDHEQFQDRTNPERGDILITKDGTLGITRVVRTDTVFSIFVSVALIKPVCYQMSDYLELSFSSPQLQQQMLGTGSGLLHLHLKDIRQYLVPIAPLEEQKEIVNRISKYMELIDSIKSECINMNISLSTLDQSILSKAFKGELVEQDPNDEPASVLLERIQKEREKEKKTVKQTGTKKPKK